MRSNPFPSDPGYVEAVSWGAAVLSQIVSRDIAEVSLGVVDSEAVESLARRESRWLLEAAAVAAGRDPLFLRQAELTPRVVAVFRSHVARRSRGEPLAYVIGESSFCGLDLIVTPDVLIPRPETEQFVELALTLIPADRDICLLDQGTGCGAIAIAIAMERPRLRAVAIDIAESAVDIARRNALRHGLGDRIQVCCGDLFPAEGTFDFLAANLPYIRNTAALPTVLDEWEPRGALRAGPTGSEIIRRSIAGAAPRMTGLLETNLLYEIGEDQEAAEAGSFGSGWTIQNDLAGKGRFLIGAASRGRA